MRMNLRYKCLRVTLECVEPGPLPEFKGFSVRGMLLSRLREANPEAIERYLYGGPDGTPFPSGVTLTPPLDRSEFAREGDRLHFHLHLFEDAAEADAELVLPLAERRLRLGAARFRLARVEDVGSGETVFDGERYRFVPPRRLSPLEPEGDLIVVSTLTPTYLVHEGRARVPRFHMIVRNAARRLTMLRRRFGEEGLTREEARELIRWSEGARTVSMSYRLRTLRRRSSRIGRQEFRAVVGTFVYELPPDPPARAGEVLSFAAAYGVGKMNTAGLGRIALTCHPPGG